MESISLKEASELVGKDQSTIRKTFQKPNYKDFTTIKRGKIFINKDKLLEIYPLDNEYIGQNSELGGIGRNVPNDAELPPKKESIQESAVDTAMQALISQLEAKDRQIDSLLQRIFEINSNHQRLLQKDNTQQPVEQQSVPGQEQPIQKKIGKSWKIIALIALAVLGICAVAFVVALINGFRFMQ